MRLNEVKNVDEIFNFIENELRNSEHPIFVEISKKIMDTYGVDIYPARISQICKKINEEKGLNINFSNRHNPITLKKREYNELCKEADASGITDEEIYLCHLRGYSYGVMCRIYFEMTGKLLNVDYFSTKFIRYCNEHEIPVTRNTVVKSNPHVFEHITEQDLKKHSEFFNKMYFESRVRNTGTQRRQATTKLIDPYKKLHEEMKNDTTLLTDFDER